MGIWMCVGYIYRVRNRNRMLFCSVFVSWKEWLVGSVFTLESRLAPRELRYPSVGGRSCTTLAYEWDK